MADWEWMVEVAKRLDFILGHPKRYAHNDDDQKDQDEYIEEMSLGGRIYRERR